MSVPRVYLAGPEVFLPDALQIGRAKIAICAEAGLEGVFPLDPALPLEGCPKREQARRIALSCEVLMRSCEALIANLTPFRGVSADAGTAFEMGFMRALGRPVLGYTNAPGDYRARAEVYRAGPRLAFDGDRPGIEVEDFSLADNAMLAVAVLESGGEVGSADAGGEVTFGDLAAFRRCVAEARRILIA